MSGPSDVQAIPPSPSCHEIPSIRTGDDEAPVAHRRLCPHGSQETRPDGRLYGRCAFLGAGDLDGTLLLFDQVRECGETPDEENDP